MSYSFTVKAEGNTLTIEQQTQVPDGYYQVNGHEQAEWLNIGVMRQDLDHLQIAQASGYAKHPES